MSNGSKPTIEDIIKTLNEIVEIQKKIIKQREEDERKRREQREEDERKMQKQREEDERKMQKQREEDERKRREQREEDERKRREQREEDERKMQKQREEDERKMQKQREEDERKMQKQREEDERESEKSKKEMEEIRKQFRDLAEYQRESFKSIDKEFKKVSKQFGKWGNELGYLVESVVQSSLKEILNKKNMDIVKVAQNVNSRSYDGSDEDWEFDFVAIGGSKKLIVVVESKATLEIKEVKRFLQKLRNVTKWCPHYRGFKVYGGVAYLKDKEKASTFAQENGLFVIHAAGDAAKMMNPDQWSPTDIPQAESNNN